MIGMKSGTNSFHGTVQGLNQVNEQYQQRYGPGTYLPDVRLTYWTIRIMAYAGSISMLIALAGWWLWRRSGRKQ